MIPRDICHKDGTVTYWSVYEQVWNRRALVLPDRETAAMDPRERERIMRHMTLHHWRPCNLGMCAPGYQELAIRYA